MKKICLLFTIGLFTALATQIVSCTTTEKGTATVLPQYSQAGWKAVNICGGGMIPGLVYNTSKKGVLYARTDMGGAYRWNPDNESWIPLTDFAGYEDYGRLGIASIATDPVEPNRLVIASGTYTNDWDKNAQMLVSQDYGNHFDRIDVPFKMGGNMPGRGVGERLAIDPNNNKIVYFGSFGDGLWCSTDYGYHWELIKSFPTKGNVYDYDFDHWSHFKHFFGIMWVIFDSASGTAGNGSQHIYAGVADTGTTIYESLDAGETWHPLANQPDIGQDLVNPPYAKLSKEGPGEGEHAHKVENCECKKFYPIKGIYSPAGELLIAYNAGFGPFNSSYQGGAIWKYNFGTKEWTDISLPVHDPDPSRVTLARGVGSVAVDWQHPQNLVAVTLNEWWPDEYIYRSTNGGKTWDPIWYMDGWPNRVDKYTYDYSDAPWLDWGETGTPPVEAPKLSNGSSADIEIDPFDSDTMLFVGGAGVTGTNELTAWDENKRIPLKVLSRGIEECAVLALISPTEGAHLLSGVGDLGGFVHKNLMVSTSMYTNPRVRAVNSLDYAQENPYFIVRIGDGTFAWSEDGGDTWTPAAKYLDGVDTGWSGNTAVSPDAKTCIWAPGNLVAEWTEDGGKTWTVCAGLPKGAKVISDRVNPLKFYAFGNDGQSDNFYASTDGARTFTLTADSKTWNPQGLERSASDLKAVIGCENHLWFAAGKAGMLHSEDGGRTWVHIQNVDNALVIGLGKAAPGADYQALYTNSSIKGKYGIYRSDDKGSTWVRINDDQHQFGSANSAITGDPRIYGRVYLGTNGRGIQYRDLE